MSLLSSWLAAAPPDAAVEIAPEGVSVAVVSSRGRELLLQACGVAPLPPGAVQPSLSGRNIIDKAAVAAALGAACEQAGVRPKRVALLIPDLAARVSLVRFETVPARSDDLDQLLQWQLRKSAPFPIEEGVVTYSAGAAGAGGREFLVEVARRDIVREYEEVCESQGMHAGLVDLPTLSVVNLFLGGETAPPGDWLVLHMRPTYTSIVLMRGPDVMFFRSRAEDDAESLEEVAHQTAMYYEDRLEGRGFSRLLLGGLGQGAGSIEGARRRLEDRFGTRVESIDPTLSVMPVDRITVTPALAAALAPLVGVLRRSQREVVGA